MLNIFRFISKYLNEYKKTLIVYISITVFFSVFSLVTPYINGRFIDLLLSTSDVNIIYYYAVIILLLFIINLFLGYYMQIKYIKIQTNTAYLLTKDVLNNFLGTSLKNLEKQDPVYLTQLISGDSNALTIFCMTIIQEVIINTLRLIIPLFILMKINIYLSLVFIILLISYYCLYKLYKSKIYKWNKKISESKSSFFSATSEIMQFGRYIKIQAIENEVTKKLDKNFKSLFNEVLILQKLNYFYSSSDQGISTIAQIVLFIIGGVLIINKNLTIGMFTVFSSYFNMLMGAVKYFYSLGSNYQGILVSYNRINEYLSFRKESDGVLKLKNVDSISVENVEFKYSNESKSLKYENILFEKGKIYALIGSNGSGKSTLLTLLCGIYIDDIVGNIKINGIDMSLIDKRHYRKNCLSYLDQNPVMFSERSDHNDYDSDIFCDKINDFDKLIINNDKMLLSGGEKQKLYIKSILNKSTDLIILDEPTNSLENESIDLLMEHLSKIKKDKIIIIVTHDQKLTLQCDQVYNIVSSKTSLNSGIEKIADFLA